MWATVDEFSKNLVDIPHRQQNNTVAFGELSCLPISPGQSLISSKTDASGSACACLRIGKIVARCCWLILKNVPAGINGFCGGFKS